ncbi:Uncharacterised protein [Mycoplasmopsis californica]|uniref:type II site-specific deoxyribonuclease n=1 Tax=Mycoplasmopsis equigenitalium TaxID=114883 RepID=A0ABY5J362_9BACT|nr:hypothetical protein [Mycoplasmopsis equigenitalium]UUD37218.1 hypothetical protein NPA09_01435 [Mycoplasmopsis equigenitalium]VEU69477.1 Uncharacterised protein [Mycoplasmopsis californica]
MYISYDEFIKKIKSKIKEDEEFYSKLLKNIINNPKRYVGIFRLSNAKTKLLQNITQSIEIKFGDLLEDITRDYIKHLGYKNLDKRLEAKNSDGRREILNIDQYFTDGQTVYMVEMKVRDDHDSSKKRGQLDNFKRKLEAIQRQNKCRNIVASMWFVDGGMVKNKKFYVDELDKVIIPNTELHLFYGSEFFNSLKNGNEAWKELIFLLENYHKLNKNENVEIPNFGNSNEVLNALIKLPNKEWKKLLSNEDDYIQIREELFSSGDNLEKAKESREYEKGLER